MSALAHCQTSQRLARAMMLLVVSLFPGFVHALTAAEREQPNILFIFLDDFGWKDAGFMGSDFFESPHIDRLAAEGMIFTNAYSCASNCAPARACLLSGQYTPRHQIFNVGTGPRGKSKYRRLQHIPGVHTLDPSIRTWAQCIRDAGYRTATIGKWHLSDDPLPYGFDVNIGGTHSGSPPRGYYPPHNVPGLRDAPPQEYLTDRLSDEAIRFIRDSRDKPWLLYLTHFAVHTPLDAKRELIDKYRGKTPGTLHQHVAMATMIQSVDEGIGRIRAALEELNIADNTVVVFYSDNGGYNGATDMDPLRGCKGTYYEGGIREPFFVKWPGRIQPGQRTDQPVIGVDLYPTLSAIAGARVPENQPQDGVNLLPLLTGKTTTLEERSLFWHFPAYLQASADEGGEARDGLFRSRPCSIIRHGDWKLHQYFEDGGLELYNLQDDLGETTNLADREPQRTQELLTRLRDWQHRVAAPIPVEPNPEYDAVAETAELDRLRNRPTGRKNRRNKS